MRKRCK